MLFCVTEDDQLQAHVWPLYNLPHYSSLYWSCIKTVSKSYDDNVK